MQKYHIALLLSLLLVLSTCEKNSQVIQAKLPIAKCEQGISQKQIDDLIVVVNEFKVSRAERVELFLSLLGNADFPQVSPGCFGVSYAEVLAGVIPDRMVSFELSPFSTQPHGNVVKTMYMNLVQQFAQATLGEWQPKAVSVSYTGNGNASITFNAFGQRYHWRVDQHEAIDRVGDEFFDNLVSLEMAKLSGMYYNLSRNGKGYYAYLPKKLVPVLSRMGVR